MLCGTRGRRSGVRADALPGYGNGCLCRRHYGGIGIVLSPRCLCAFVGGSLVPHGGQNPLEPARLHCAVMAGPHTENFAPAYEAIFAAQGAGRVRSSAGLVAAVRAACFSNPSEARAMGEAAARAAHVARRRGRADAACQSKICWPMRAPEFWSRAEGRPRLAMCRARARWLGLWRDRRLQGRARPSHTAPGQGDLRRKSDRRRHRQDPHRDRHRARADRAPAQGPHPDARLWRADARRPAVVHPQADTRVRKSATKRWCWQPRRR